MVTPVFHRKWARKFLARAERSQSYARKCRYLRLAVSNTLRARKLEKNTIPTAIEGRAQETDAGSAESSPTPKR